MTQQRWQEGITRRVAEELRRLRGENSVQWLSDRTAELGYRVSRSTISDMEVGRRTRFEVAELIVLAAALGVPPVALLYPGVLTEEVELLPGVSCTAFDAAQWFSGLAMPGWRGITGADGGASLRLRRAHDDLWQEIRILDIRTRDLRSTQAQVGLPEDIDRASDPAAWIEARELQLDILDVVGEIIGKAGILEHIRESLQACGQTPPTLDLETLDAWRRGVLKEHFGLLSDDQEVWPGSGSVVATRSADPADLEEQQPPSVGEGGDDGEA
jgi:hypothetical protein